VQCSGHVGKVQCGSFGLVVLSQEWKLYLGCLKAGGRGELPALGKWSAHGHSASVCSPDGTSLSQGGLFCCFRS
jgi:hypothetical protein